MGSSHQPELVNKTVKYRNNSHFLKMPSRLYPQHLNTGMNNTKLYTIFYMSCKVVLKFLNKICLFYYQIPNNILKPYG